MKSLISFTLVLCLASATFFQACVEAEPSDLVDQDRIFTDYELFYNENTDVTRATAIFRFGSGVTGTPLELAGSSEVSFEGEMMVKKVEPITNITYYVVEMAGKTSTGTFRWEDTEGTVYENAITLVEIGYPADLPATLSRTESFTLTWDGTALGADESVAVTVDGPNAFNEKVFTQSAQGSTSIILTKDKLDDIDPGEGKLFMDRNFSPEIMQAPGAGGRITAKYRPVNPSITIE
ncbi:MAG: hypothetical protein AAFR61_28555 [Bacteroidota bacterium]